MAVFMLNICKFDDCGITFPSLADLILHIEDTHIDYDPAVIEAKEQQQPQCLPLSYVLKFYSNSARRESQLVDIKKRLIQHANKTASQSYTSFHNEQDDEEPVTESEDSNESWTASEEFSSEYILKYGSKMTNPSTSAVSSDKPFVCPVPGCKKRYKNLNGIKYHSKNGHKNDGKMRKRYKCHCKKSYKTAQGLKNHLNTQHSSCFSINSSEVQSAQILDSSITRTVTTKQIRGGLLSPVLKQTDPKTLEALRLKAIVENSKKLLMAKVPEKKAVGSDGVVETELGILTPATSPDSSPSSTHLPLNSANSALEFQIHSSHCDIN